jgi:integrase
MPDAIAESLRQSGFLRSLGPHAPSTVQRRLANWSTLTRWRGLKGEFGAPTLRSAMRLAVRAAVRPRQRKSRRAVTGDIIAALLKTCAGDTLRDRRDRALLLVAFGSGGRRRSEIAGLYVEQLVEEEPLTLDGTDTPSLPCLSIHLGRTKTSSHVDDEHVLLIGGPVLALKEWLDASEIESGAVFRSIDRWGNLESRALSPQAVNLILKTRISAAGLDPTAFSAHGLRSGYLTEAANLGIPLPEAMQQSLHKSVVQAARYYNDVDRKKGRAARVIA